MSRVKVEIFRTRNKQWSFRVIRGARIILGPEESYVQRGGVRRAVKSLADISTDKSSSSWVSALQAAALHALIVEEREWEARKR